METSKGFDILYDLRRNKGTAFSEEEHINLGLLELLLPNAIESVDLLQLLENNETLFCKVLMDDPPTYMPLVSQHTVSMGIKH
jgi:hypothetical protein